MKTAKRERSEKEVRGWIALRRQGRSRRAAAERAAFRRALEEWGIVMSSPTVTNDRTEFARAVRALLCSAQPARESQRHSGKTPFLSGSKASTAAPRRAAPRRAFHLIFTLFLLLLFSLSLSLLARRRAFLRDCALSPAFLLFPFSSYFFYFFQFFFPPFFQFFSLLFSLAFLYPGVAECSFSR